MCLLFLLSTDNALAECVCLRHNKKPPGVTLASFFLYDPTVLKFALFHHMLLACSLERGYKQAAKMLDFIYSFVFLALLKSVFRGCKFMNIN